MGNGTDGRQRAQTTKPATRRELEERVRVLERQLVNGTLDEVRARRLVVVDERGRERVIATCRELEDEASIEVREGPKSVRGRASVRSFVSDGGSTQLSACAGTMIGTGNPDIYASYLRDNHGWAQSSLDVGLSNQVADHDETPR